MEKSHKQTSKKTRSRLIPNVPVFFNPERARVLLRTCPRFSKTLSKEKPVQGRTYCQHTFRII